MISINTNQSALESLSALENTTSQLNKATEELSTGLSINNPGDNPSGEAIVQTMTAQINGLNAAQQNAQNGLSVLQTAGGALNTVSTILQNLNTLAVTAANTATEGSNDTALIQSQVIQLTAELDRLSSTVTFNGQNLLDGSYSGEVLQVSNDSQGGGAGDPNQLQFSLDGVSTALLGLSGLGVTGSGAGTAASAVGLAISAVTATAAKLTAPVTDASGLSASDELSAVTGMTAAQAGTLTVNGQSVAYSGSETLTTLFNAISTATGGAVTGSLNLTSSTTGTIALTTTATGTAAALNLSDSVGGGGLLAEFGLGTTASGGVSATGQALNSSSTLGDLGASTGSSVVGSGTLTVNGAAIAYSATESIGALLTAINSSTAGVTATLNTTGPDAGTVTVKTTATGTTATLALSDSNGSGAGSALGALGLSASSTAGTSSSGMTAANAIELINSAINQVATETGQIGAVMDRLNFTVSNLGDEVQNTTASQGTIEDVDMAAEMSAFTQLQILQQSGTAMLAQANQEPQSILKLMQ